MATAAPAESVGLFKGLEQRRSKRIHRPIRLLILGRDPEGRPYREKMSTVSLSFHGCCFQSRHNSQIGAKVELQLAEGLVNRSPLLRASVRYVRPMYHAELFQIGVEFDTPHGEWLSP